MYLGVDGNGRRSGGGESYGGDVVLVHARRVEADE